MNTNKALNILFILMIILMLFSCRKTTPPKALIITYDTAYRPIAGVKVTIYAKPNGSYVYPNDKVLKLEEYTNSSGEARFEFKNEAIFNVKAEKGNPPTLKAEGMIFLKENEEVKKVLILR